jgi:16S rRNA processing protein RimM
MKRTEFLETGKIVSTHGIKGEVKIYPWCDSPEFICSLENIYTLGGKRKYKVLNARAHKGMVIMALEGVNTMNEASQLRGTVVYLNRDDVALDEGTYFVRDLLGLEVLDKDGKSYGKIIEVTETGANDVYHIKNDEGKVFLIPAIKDVVLETDLENGVTTVFPMKGLFDDED